MGRVDFSKIRPLSEMSGEDAEESAQLSALYARAEAFLSRQSWCATITKAYFGLGVADIVAVFLFELVPAGDADPMVWVVVGDIPPAYIVTDAAPNPACALDAYIGEMTRWADAAGSGGPVTGLIPVNVDPTPANAARLRKRLHFLDRKILDCYRADLV